MPGNPHPAGTVFGAGNVSKAAVIGFIKEYLRLSVADVDAVTNTDLSGQYGGIYVRSLGGQFDINTESTAPPNGSTILQDASGVRFVRSIDQLAAVVRTYTDDDVVAGAIEIDNDADLHLLDLTAASITLTMMAAADRSRGPLSIKDIGGTAAAGAPFTPAFDGSELCDGLAGTAFAIASPYGSQKFWPKTGGWYQLFG